MGNSKSDLINIGQWASKETSLAGKKAVVVGGTNGLGLAISEALLEENAFVTVIGRKEPKRLTEKYAKNVKFMSADLSLIKTMDKVANNIENPSEIDLLIFTTGIFAAPKLELTEEDVERDLATSYISRYVILNKLIEKGLNQNSKVYVMGFPGNGEGKVNLEDFQYKNKYSALACHIATTIDNEALVLANKDKVNIYGLNPGLIQTDIRKNYTGEGSVLTSVVETIIGLLNITAEKYAKDIVIPILKAKDIPSGKHFSQKGVELKPNPWLVEENGKNTSAIMSETDKIVRLVLG